MRKPIVFLCETLFALWVATSVAQAQVGSYTDPYAPEPPYLSVVEQLFPAHPPAVSAFNRPPAAVGTFTLDFLLLNRSRLDSNNLMTVDGADSQDAADMDFGTTGAIRFTAVLPSPCGVDLQFSYLSSHEFMEVRSYSGGTVLSRLFNGTATASTTREIAYEAPLDSFELNLRARQWERFAPLVGLRLVTLDEVSLQRNLAVDTGRVAGYSYNRMAGMQFGGEWLVGQVGRWRCEAVLKAGFFYNAMSIEGYSSNANMQRRFSSTSFLGEVNAMVVYVFTPNARFRIGYQGLWMEGVALLYDQYDNFDLTNGNGSVDLGSLNFQGGYLGFDITW